MPNWCFNRLQVTGPEGAIARFQEAAKAEVDGKQVSFCFQALHPMPEGLLDLPAAPGQEPAWLSWRLQNWGTKWDLTHDDRWETFRETDIEMNFDTASRPPDALVKKISKDFPELSFYLQYAEPGMDFSGTLGVKGGNVYAESHGKFRDSDLALDDETEE